MGAEFGLCSGAWISPTGAMSGLPNLAYLVHTPHPFLIQFNEKFGVRYYGLAYLLGFLVGFWLFRRYHRSERTPLDGYAAGDLMVALVIGVMAGGRLGYYFLYEGWRRFSSDPFEIFRLWDGGMASHGGFIGVGLALAWFARSRKLSFLHLCDVVLSAAPAGLLFGRIANYLNGELWGQITTLPWGVIFEATGGGNLPRHPSQLYEAVLEGALLLATLQWRFWRTDIVVRQPGRLAGEFLVGYALARIFCEFFREPDKGISLAFDLMSRGTFYSLFMIVVGLVLILRRSKTGPAT
jgi:phosphatidylglycerol---prolipoprotein diacylglyceryl transferase